MDSDRCGDTSIKYQYWTIKILLIIFQVVSMIFTTVFVILYGVVTHGQDVPQAVTITVSVLVAVFLLVDLIGLVGSAIDKIALIIFYALLMAIFSCICFFVGLYGRAIFLLFVAAGAGYFAFLVKKREDSY